MILGLSTTALAGLVLAVGVLVIGGSYLYERHTRGPDQAAPAPEERGEAWGELAAQPVIWTGRALAATVGAFAKVLFRRSWGKKIWKRLVVGGLWQLHKQSGSDAIGLNHLPSGNVELVPVRHCQKLGEIGEEPGWKEKGGDRAWEASAQGNAVTFIGRTPVVMLDDDADSIGTWLDARVTDAIDKGNMRDLYRVDHGEFTAEITYPQAGGAGAGAAVTDGGTNADVWTDFNPTSSPIFEDTLIDLGSNEGFNGAAMSFRHYKDTDRDSTSQEKLKMAEERGKLVGMNPEQMKAFIIKVLLIVAALGAVASVGDVLLGALLGGGGGGAADAVGGVVPGMLGFGGWF
ncbi:hypothetical protein [Halomarina oriensis]|uniref:Uncharacterized protein n=1 Tax=Halomarina oriensis TaxID=671145 RepID=A0A6B0GUT1_9EURY|nr:hypothetical protein [Halomarina oriensis]MWG35895.1 hypothetical protein [Halomarina oriensis]